MIYSFFSFGLLLSFASQKVSPCQSSPCQNSGLCVDQRDDFVCVCRPGFGGNTCGGERTLEKTVNFLVEASSEPYQEAENTLGRNDLCRVFWLISSSSLMTSA